MSRLTAEQITPQTPHVAVMDVARRTAVEIAKSMLPYYTAAYPDDLRPHMSLPTALDFLSGLETESCLAQACVIAQAALDNANRHAETCDINHIARYWAAADAAEAVVEALSPVVDLAAVRRLADEARKRFAISTEA